MFRYKLGMSETGITDLFVFDIVNFCYRKTTNVSIFKTTWPIESLYGNDIDLFIQRADGKYNWFALQAKVMKNTGAYEDIKIKALPNQWDKLQSHELKFGSKAFYLLYNGKPLRKKVVAATRADCLGTPSVEEYGLGIVDVGTVKSVRLAKRTYQKVYFNDFFPDNMDSVRKLFCCEHKDSGSANQRGYDILEIYTGVPYESVFVSADGKFEETNYEADDYIDEKLISDINQAETGIAPIRIIINTN